MIRDLKYAKYTMDNELKGKIIRIDNGFTAITGYEWKDVSEKNMTIFDLLPEEQRQEYIKTVYEAEAVGEAFLNHAIKCKDGTVITVNCYGEVYNDTETGHACTKILITDVTKQENAVKELEDKEEQLLLHFEKVKFLTENTQETFLDYDIEKDKLEISRFVKGEYEIFYSKENYFNSKASMVYDDDYNEFKDILCMADNEIKSVFDFRSKLFTDSYLWYRLIYVKYINPLTGRNHIIGRLINVNEEKQDSLDLEKNADIDILTGVYNSRATELKINKILSGNKEWTKTDECIVDIGKMQDMQAMLAIDIDSLRMVNGKYGFDKGDLVLGKTSEILRVIFRQDFDIIGRVYGGVFVVLARNIIETSYIEERCNEICRRIKEELSKELFGDEYVVTASIGIALSDKKSNTFKKLFTKTVKAMQRQKEKGGDGVSF